MVKLYLSKKQKPKEGRPLYNMIIQQNCVDFIEKVCRFLSDKNVKGFPELEDGLKELSNEFIRKMIKAYLEKVDQAVLEDKKGRKELGLAVERRADRRTVYTKAGYVDFERTYYRNDKESGYVYMADKAAGLESYERISLSVSAGLANQSSETSYGLSSRNVTGGDISRQTVMNKLRNIHDLKNEGPKSKRSIKVLQITADEDHISLQTGNKTQVPLITIYEGIRRTGKTRNECINPRHFSMYGESVEDLWLEVSQWIDEQYEAKALERVYIHGDGANWIKAGLGYIPRSKYVLDEYHQNKALMRATGKQPERREGLRDALKEADKERFVRQIKELEIEAKDDRETERIKDYRKYILNNWDGIEIKKLEECGGCCAEGQVSHVLSARLSSRPMGWSGAGLKVMSKLRAYRVNGGEVQPEHIRKAEGFKTVLKKAIKKAKKAFSHTDPNILGNIYALSAGKVTPLFRELKAIQYGNQY